MKKIIVLIMALVLFFVPFGSAFAYTGGLLNGKKLIRASDVSSFSSEHVEFTDNNETTGLTVYPSGGNDTVYYEFAEPVTLDAYQLKASNGVKIAVVLADGQIKNIASAGIEHGSKTSFTAIPNVKKVYLENTAPVSVTVYEFDVFGSVATPSNDYSGGLLDGKSFFTGSTPTSTSTTTRVLTDNSESTVFQFNSTSNKYATYKFAEPVNITSFKKHGAGILYFKSKSGTEIYSNASTLNGSLIEGQWNQVYEIQLFGTSGSVSEINVFSESSIDYDELSNLTLSATQNTIDLNWNIPSGNADFTGTKIYKNGVFFKSVDSSTKTFTDSDVSSNTDYTYKITAVYSDGHETQGLSQSVTTKSPPPPDRDGDGIPDDEDEYPDDPTNTPPPVEAGEVKNLEITTTYKSANLSWVLPKSENLQHVNIYRETLTQETSFMDKLINGKTVYAAGEKIFETNGTYFNDYTVEPGTEYEYKVTTTSVDGVESEGVTGRTKTPGKPLVDFEEVSLPFSAKDLILSGNSLLWIIGPFILLALAFLLVPKLRNLIIGAFRKDSKGSSEAAERRTKAEAIQKMERQEAKEFRTAREPKSERVEVAPKPIREPKEIRQPRIRESKERIRTAKLSRERIREPRVSREPKAPRERTRKPRDRRGIS
ncbi:hypothetical protein NX029_28460 [Cytobacillus firmus]|nr:hypothetical protein [Cytobacillus firmus]